MIARMASAGSALVLMAAIGFGLNPLFARLLYAEGLGAEMVTLYRFIVPAFLLLFFIRTPRPQWPEAGRMLIIGAINGVAILGYFYALETINAATAILIYYTYPFFSVVLGWLIFKRKASQNSLAAAALVLVAASLVIVPETLNTQTLIAIALCTSAPLVFSFQIQYLSAPTMAIPAIKRLAWGTMGHIIILIPLVIMATPVQVLPVSATGVMAILGIAIVAAALPQLLFLIGVPKTTPERTAIFGSVELVVAMLSGALLLGDNLGQYEITAMLLILIALLIKQNNPIIQEGLNTNLKSQPVR
jgi:drug/metabolite transporter (DMT)-like permease